MQVLGFRCLRFLTTLLLLGFLVHCGAGGTECPSQSPDGFRSKVLLQFTTPTPDQCTLAPTPAFPTGKRPLCASTIWEGPPSMRCRVNGLKAFGCQCFEGQAQACDVATGGPCPSGVGCGVKVCLVASDTSSSWTSCLPL